MKTLYSFLGILLFTFTVTVSASASTINSQPRSSTAKTNAKTNAKSDANSVVMHPGESVTLNPTTETTTVYCDGGSHVTCVQDCVRRGTDLTCWEYGPDFCGMNAQCVPHCIRRDTQNNCYEYDADICRASGLFNFESSRR